jgi:hypothetical protein
MRSKSCSLALREAFPLNEKNSLGMKNLIALAVALTTLAINSQAQDLNSESQPTFTYQITNFDAHSPTAWPTPFIVPTTPQSIATTPPMDYYGSPTPTPLRSWVPTPTPGTVTITTVPMTQQDRDKLRRERIAKEEDKRKLFEKQEAEREAHGDFSQAPGLTPEQRQAAAIRWAEKNANETIKGATPAPQ